MQEELATCTCTHRSSRCTVQVAQLRQTEASELHGAMRAQAEGRRAEATRKRQLREQGTARALGRGGEEDKAGAHARDKTGASMQDVACIPARAVPAAHAVYCWCAGVQVPPCCTTLVYSYNVSLCIRLWTRLTLIV